MVSNDENKEVRAPSFSLGIFSDNLG